MSVDALSFVPSGRKSASRSGACLAMASIWAAVTAPISGPDRSTRFVAR